MTHDPIDTPNDIAWMRQLAEEGALTPMRGGSFLCSDQYCSRYIVGTRGKGEVSSGTNHIGFRCVKEPDTVR